MIARGRNGERSIGAADFFKDVFTTALAPDEILTEIRLPLSSGIRWGFEVIRGQGGSYATAIAAVLLHTRGSVCESASIAIGACSPTPIRLSEAEEIIGGKALSEELFIEASSAVRSHLPRLLMDARVHADYRREMAALATRRALFSAAGAV